MKAIRTTVAALALAASTQAMAQSADDVVVMRRTLAPPSLALTARWEPDAEWTWSEGPACREDAPRHRALHCVSDGREVASTFCANRERPPETSTAGRYDACTFSWSRTAIGQYSSTCAVDATRSDTYSCIRSDGTPVDEGSTCGGAAAPQPERQDVLTGCRYGWKTGSDQWSSTCSADARRTRAVGCQILDPVPGDTSGRYAGKNMHEANCDAATRPADTDPDRGNWSGCKTKLYDPGFETVIWTVYGDGEHQASRLANGGRSGNAGLPGYLVSEEISLAQGAWDLTFWIRTVTGGTASVDVSILGSNGTAPKAYQATSTWTRQSLRIANGGGIKILFNGNRTVAVDDVNIAPAQ